MKSRISLLRIASLIPLQVFPFPGAQASAQDQLSACMGSSIPFETSTLERIMGETAAVVEEGRSFWEAEQPLVLAQGWADEVRSPNPYQRFRDAVKGLASLSPGNRAAHPVYRMTAEIIARQDDWIAEALPHLCSFFPGEVDLSRPAYFVAFIPPRAFATSEGIVIDVASDYWKGNPENILNLMIHEFFHVGFGQQRSERADTPLSHARLNSIAEMIQNEGMAVWVAYQARGSFPAPAELDNLLLEDPDEVASRRTALNDLFERSSSISDDQLRQQGWRIGVTNRAYYIVGAHMARLIQEARGKEALVQTITQGPLSFIRLYNTLAPEEERLRFPGL